MSIDKLIEQLDSCSQAELLAISQATSRRVIQLEAERLEAKRLQEAKEWEAQKEAISKLDDAVLRQWFQHESSSYERESILKFAGECSK